MNPSMLLGTLAFGTLGIGLIAMVWHLSSQLRDPLNRAHASNIFLRNGKGAATSTAENAEPGSQLSKPLSVRLNESIDSQHEIDPAMALNQAQRAKTFHDERADSATNV